MKNGTPIIINEQSVFVGVEGSVDIPQKLWCHGSEDWDVCSWVWQDDTNKNCQLIDGTSINECTDQYINIDKNLMDCTIIFYSGLDRNNHEGSWQCRLSKSKIKVWN